MASSSIPFKLSKTCSTYVPCHGKVIVKVTCPLWSLPTTIAIMQVSRLHPSRSSMAKSVGHLFVGTR
jgi:hypothetical protein